MALTIFKSIIDSYLRGVVTDETGDVSEKIGVSDSDTNELVETNDVKDATDCVLDDDVVDGVDVNGVDVDVKGSAQASTLSE